MAPLPARASPARRLQHTIVFLYNSTGPRGDGKGGQAMRVGYYQFNPRFGRAEENLDQICAAVA
ncbi:MAG: hypothetical protein JW820_14095, partial [Spirochaetales bacterium]|nr:hypothetical protein [Spirochaetales bacterium]